jgi:hypothetical protein
LIIGRYVDDDFHRELSDLAGFPVKIFSVTNHTFATPAALATEGDAHFVHPDPVTAVGHKFTEDIFGSKMIVVEVTHPALTLIQGRDEIRMMAYAAGMAALLAALFTILIAEITLRSCMARCRSSISPGTDRASVFPPRISRF